MPAFDFFTSGADAAGACAAGVGAAGLAVDAGAEPVPAFAGAAGVVGVVGIVCACAIKPENARSAVMRELFNIVLLPVSWRSCHAATTGPTWGG